MKKLLLVVLVCVLCSGQVYAEEKQKPAPTTPSKSLQPIKVVIELENGKFYIGKETLLYYQTFVFDPEKKSTGSPGGLALTFGDCPVPLVIYGLSYGLSGSFFARYANVIFDLGELSGKAVQRLGIGEQVTTKGAKCCIIRLLTKNYKELFVSPDYIVFPNSLRKIAKGGPFVKMVFDPTPIDKENESPIVGNLVVRRNAEEIGRAKIDGTTKITFLFEGTRNSDDVVEWQVKGQGEKITHRGELGFPISAAVPGLVEYWLHIANGQATEEKK